MLHELQLVLSVTYRYLPLNTNMDSYTQNVQPWLDRRFRKTDSEGIYHAHQPIYGFRKGHSESGLVERYIITYQIMNALSQLEFSSLLDVGGAEGYKAALARSLFNVKVRSVDLSQEACKRAKEIFNVEGEPIDIHHLPYEDDEFDVVLCSETLEHVPNIVQATEELIRVCRKAVVITVPHESKDAVEKNIREKIPHAHIHSLDTNSFDFATSKVSRIVCKRSQTPFLKALAVIASAEERKKIRNYPQLFVTTYNKLVPLLALLHESRNR